MSHKPTAYEIGMSAEVSRLEAQFADAAQRVIAAQQNPTNASTQHGRDVLRQCELTRDHLADELKEARARLANPAHGRELTDC